MTRLDELLQMRAELDRAITEERAAHARHTEILSRVSVAVTRGTWDNRVFVATCTYFDVSPDDVLAPTPGTRRVVNARRVAMWLMRHSNRSLTEIGRQIGRDHSTVLKGCRHVDHTPDLQAAAAEIYLALTGTHMHEETA